MQQRGELKVSLGSAVQWGTEGRAVGARGHLAQGGCGLPWCGLRGVQLPLGRTMECMAPEACKLDSNKMTRRG